MKIISTTDHHEECFFNAQVLNGLLINRTLMNVSQAAHKSG